MAELLETVKSLTRAQAGTSGKSEGVGDMWKLLIAAVGLIATLSALGVFSSRSATPAVQPQVIYAPAPPGALLPSAPSQNVPR